MLETDVKFGHPAPDTAPVGPVLHSLLAAADRARLERENRRLGRRLAVLAAEVTHLRRRQRLDRMLVERERSLRLEIIASLRALVSEAGTTVRRPAGPKPKKRYQRDEIPSFLREGVSAADAGAEPTAGSAAAKPGSDALVQRLAKRHLAWLGLGWS